MGVITMQAHEKKSPMEKLAAIPGQNIQELE